MDRHYRRRADGESLERLNQARVTAKSPKGIVTVVYDERGNGVSMELKAGSRERYDAESMARFSTSAFAAADRALDALHQHAFEDLSTSGHQWRSAPPDASRTVSECFGTRG